MANATEAPHPRDDTGTDVAPTAFELVAAALRALHPGTELERLATAEAERSGSVAETLGALEAHVDARIMVHIAYDFTPFIEHVLAAGVMSRNAAAVYPTLREIELRKEAVLLEPGRLADAIEAVACCAARKGAWLDARTELLLEATMQRSEAVLSSRRDSRILRALAASDVVSAAELYVDAAVNAPETWKPIRIGTLLGELGVDDTARRRGQAVAELASSVIEQIRPRDEHEPAITREVRTAIHDDAVHGAVERELTDGLLAPLARLHDADPSKATYARALAFAARRATEAQRGALARHRALDAVPERETDDPSRTVDELARHQIACALLITEAPDGNLSRSLKWLDSCTRPTTRYKALADTISHTVAQAPTNATLARLLEALTTRLVEDASNTPAATTTEVWEDLHYQLHHVDASPDVVAASRTAVTNALRALANDDRPFAVAQAYLEMGFTTMDSIDAWHELLGRLLREGDDDNLAEIGTRLESTAAGVAVSFSLDRGTALRPQGAARRRCPRSTSGGADDETAGSDTKAKEERE